MGSFNAAKHDHGLVTCLFDALVDSILDCSHYITLHYITHTANKQVSVYVEHAVIKQELWCGSISS